MTQNETSKPIPNFKGMTHTELLREVAERTEQHNETLRALLHMHTERLQLWQAVQTLEMEQAEVVNESADLCARLADLQAKFDTLSKLYVEKSLA